MRFAPLLVLGVALAAPANTALAQHAGFVLFGEPNPAADIPAERQAVHPITSPFFHEDSFVTTDVRAWYIYHDFPKSSAIAGGRANAAAVQVRLALTDKLQFVAYKDGYVDIETGLVNADGFFDIAAGVKFNFLQDWEHDFHMAVGAGYELRSGQGRVLQNDDEWRIWTSVNKGFDRLHLGGTANFFFASNRNSGLGNSDHFSWHLHADYALTDRFSPVLEFNGYHVINEGLAVLPFQGLDVTNLGGGDAEDVVVVGLGMQFRAMDNLAFRAAYETPLTRKDDLFGYRWTLSAVFSF